MTTRELAKELAPRLAALLTPDTRSDHSFTLAEDPDGVSLYRDGRRFAHEPLIAGARALLLQELTRLSVPSRDFTAILHAGACGTPTAAIILAGPSYSGKSTLCAALMAAGMTCYSDDSACLTPDFHLAGMPFALALRDGERFRPSNLNGQSPLVPPVALVFVNYQPNSPTYFDPLTPFEAFHQLQQSGFWVDHTQPSIASFLRWLVAIPRFQLTYSALPDALQTLSSLL